MNNVHSQQVSLTTMCSNEGINLCLFDTPFRSIATKVRTVSMRC